MNAILVPFCAAHVHLMDVQPAQRWMLEVLRATDLGPLETNLSATLMVDRKPAACCGAMLKWEGVGFLWCLLGSGVMGRNFLPFNRLAAKFLAALPFDRVETAVEDGFEPGHRWALLQGFRRETGEAPARKFMCGRDFHLYAKVR